MHMGLLKLEQQGQLEQVVVAVILEPLVVDDAAAYCFDFFLVAGQGPALQLELVLHLPNAIQKIHNPTLFHLNVLLPYVHSWLVQNLQHCR